jgi:cation/acetate symporter
VATATRGRGAGCGGGVLRLPGGADLRRGLIASHLTGFGFDLGIFVGLGGVLVCSFLGGMRAVTWTQVAQYLVLILAYLVPLTWLSVQQTGSLMPAFSHGTQLMQIAQREAALSQDPAEREVALLLHSWRRRPSSS